MILFDKVVKVSRMKAKTGNARGYVATATGEASIQPISQDPSELTEGQYGTLYTAYVEIDLPVQQSDRIKDAEGTTYIVKEVHRRDTAPFPHQQLIINKEPL